MSKKADEDVTKHDPAEDGDDNGTTGTETDTGNDAAGNDAASNDAAGTETATGNDATGSDELSDLQAKLKAANDESAGRRHKVKALEDKIKALERAGMDEQERIAAELADLKGADSENATLKEQNEALLTAVSAQVDAMIETLNVPPHVTELLDSMDPPAKLEYLTKHRKSFTKEAPPKPDIDAGSKGKSKGKTRKSKEQREKELSKRYPSLARRRR